MHFPTRLRVILFQVKRVLTLLVRAVTVSFLSLHIPKSLFLIKSLLFSRAGSIRSRRLNLNLAISILLIFKGN
jgi:hypothetical protein